MSQVIASAPGRLDVLGGVADYSGSLVFEMPIRVVACVGVSQIAFLEFRLESSAYGHWSVLAKNFLDAQDENEVRQWLMDRQAPPWISYVLGSLWVLCRVKVLQLKTGLSLRARSRVSEGMGVSSSAALEVATVRVLCRPPDVRQRRRQRRNCSRISKKCTGRARNSCEGGTV